MKMCKGSFPDSKPWAASSQFISKGSPFHQVKVQTSREFCAAPKSCTHPDDASCPPGSETFILHPMDIHGQNRTSIVVNAFCNGSFVTALLVKFLHRLTEVWCVQPWPWSFHCKSDFYTFLWKTTCVVSSFVAVIVKYMNVCTLRNGYKHVMLPKHY